MFALSHFYKKKKNVKSRSVRNTVKEGKHAAELHSNIRKHKTAIAKPVGLPHPPVTQWYLMDVSAMYAHHRDY